jgi:uncharacterized membrane protein YphA (DoxX/SURF4 family)
MNSALTMNETPVSAPVAGSRPGNVGRYLTATGRILFGLMFSISGLNGFFNFLPQPTTPLPEGAMAFAGALMATGYMMPLIFGTHLIAGVMLLTNRFAALALVLLAPFIVNSVAFHIFLEPSGRVMAGIVLAIELALAWAYRGAYRPLLTAKPSA